MNNVNTKTRERQLEHLLPDRRQNNYPESSLAHHPREKKN